MKGLNFSSEFAASLVASYTDCIGMSRIVRLIQSRIYLSYEKYYNIIYYNYLC